MHFSTVDSRFIRQPCRRVRWTPVCRTRTPSCTHSERATYSCVPQIALPHDVLSQRASSEDLGSIHNHAHYSRSLTRVCSHHIAPTTSFHRPLAITPSLCALAHTTTIARYGDMVHNIHGHALYERKGHVLCLQRFLQDHRPQVQGLAWQRRWLPTAAATAAVPKVHRCFHKATTNRGARRK